MNLFKLLNPLNKTIVCLLITCMGVPAFAQTEIPLYPGPLPNSKPCSTIETANANGVLSGVTQPKLYVYLPEQKDSLQTAVLICPGGGYANVAIQHEGFQVAKALAKKGITAFVLKYRTPKDSACCTNTETLALQDAQQAIQVIRTNATTYGINPNKLGILGFSAGGHLAATVTTHFNTAVIENPQQTSLRPDFAVLIYPVISFQDSLTHMGSRNNMLGKNPTQAKKDWYSNELQVTDQTPPCFLLHAADDKTVKVANSMLFYNALLQHKVPAEMHLYQKGGHGFGLNNKAVTTPWLPMVLDWLKANALMKGNVQ